MLHYVEGLVDLRQAQLKELEVIGRLRVHRYILLELLHKVRFPERSLRHLLLFEVITVRLLLVADIRMSAVADLIERICTVGFGA